MTVQTVTLELPEVLYRQARQLAEATSQPIETILRDSISHSLPPLDDVAPDEAQSLAQLASLDDASLWREARVTWPDDEQRELTELLDHQSLGDLDPGDHLQLQFLLAEYGKAMVRKAHAYLLLARRGYRVPMQENGG